MARLPAAAAPDRFAAHHVIRPGDYRRAIRVDMKSHIQYLHESSIDWRPLDGSDARCKTLNDDPIAGAAIALVEIPAGWADKPHFHSHSTEVYILSGELTLGTNTTYRAGGYHYVPALVVHGAQWTSAHGALCVVQFGGAYDRVAVDDPVSPGEYALPEAEDAVSRIRHLSSADFRWETLGENKNRSSFATLRTDNLTGAQMYVLDLPPGWHGKAGPHFHSVSEEAYIVQGDVALEESPTYKSGSYLFRPPRTVHGQRERSINGCTALVWTDGPLDFNYVTVEQSLDV